MQTCLLCVYVVLLVSFLNAFPSQSFPWVKVIHWAVFFQFNRHRFVFRAVANGRGRAHFWGNWYQTKANAQGYNILKSPARPAIFDSRAGKNVMQKNCRFRNFKVWGHAVPSQIGRPRSVYIRRGGQSVLYRLLLVAFKSVEIWQSSVLWKMYMWKWRILPVKGGYTPVPQQRAHRNEFPFRSILVRH